MRDHKVTLGTLLNFNGNLHNMSLSNSEGEKM